VSQYLLIVFISIENSRTLFYDFSKGDKDGFFINMILALSLNANFGIIASYSVPQPRFSNSAEKGWGIEF